MSITSANVRQSYHAQLPAAAATAAVATLQALRRRVTTLHHAMFMFMYDCTVLLPVLLLGASVSSYREIEDRLRVLPCAPA